MNIGECALVEAEALRIAKEAAIRRWIMSFKSGTHCIGGMLVFSQFWAAID